MNKPYGCRCSRFRWCNAEVHDESRMPKMNVEVYDGSFLLLE